MTPYYDRIAQETPPTFLFTLQQHCTVASSKESQAQRRGFHTKHISIKNLIRPTLFSYNGWFPIPPAFACL